ncbi:unnamed protein product, partial [Meganyctiphanes norvegica]
HTAAESSFSNGICERNHAVVDEMVRKFISDNPQYKLSTALAWAVHAKNCMHIVGGYSPYQLVYGRNPNIPSVLSNQPPALERRSISKTFGKHLNALHKAREAFTQAESSERISRVLRHNIR